MVSKGVVMSGGGVSNRPTDHNWAAVAVFSYGKL